MADATAAESASIETRKGAEAVGGTAKFWQGQIDLSERDHKDWIKDGKTIVKRYKGDADKIGRANNRKFNILFSNTEVLKAALFARMAKPDVRRRFADQDPVGRQIAEIVERAAIYTQDTSEAEKAYEHAIEDYLLPGRGVVRVCYEAETAKGDDDKEYVAKQDLYDEYVVWDDFRHEPAKTWELVTWEAFRHRMSRDDLMDNFGTGGDDNGRLPKDEINRIPLNWSPDPNDEKVSDAYKRAEVWEIFDKTKRQRLWIVPGYDKVCRTDDDPFGLEGFFPNAEPLQAVVTNDTLIPAPEFNVYKDQADGLDEIEARIDRLTRALKRRGVYDATFKELARLSKANDNEFVPVKNYADLSTKGGLAAAFQAEDLTQLANVLKELHAQRDLRVQTIYEVVGIADIMRGDSDPRETLGAQKIKAQFGGNRLKKRQDKVQKWIRDTLRIKCEIIAEHFEPEKLAEMTGFKYLNPAMMAQMQQQMQMAQQQAQQPPQPGQPPAPPPPAPPPIDSIITPDMMKVMRDDKLRCYRIDIETDSTIFDDDEAQKAAVTEMIKAASEFVVAWMPVIQAQPSLLDLAFEMLTFALRHFKMGRTLEDVIEQTKDKLKNAAQAPRPPDPKVVAEQIKAQAAQQKAQIDGQSQQAKAQADQQKIGMEMQAHQQKHDLVMAQMSADLDLTRQKYDLERQIMQEKHQHSMELETKKASQKTATVKNSDGTTNEVSVPDLSPLFSAITGHLEAINAPKRIVRDAMGRVSHVEPMTKQ